VSEHLTSQELRVALVVAQGSTNRATAEALFLSTKTIEFHLRNIYRKLGIGSRTELVRAILTADHTDQGELRERGFDSAQ
jgi:DNA-binding NarL/FixJ family response regulator